MIVVVTGSRDWTTSEQLTVMEDTLRPLGAPDSPVLIHGNARGADLSADWLARNRLAWRAVVPVPYLDTLLGKPLERRGGPARNEVMAKIARAMKRAGDGQIILCAFPMPQSRGTWDCVRTFQGVADQTIVVRDFLKPAR